MVCGDLGEAIPCHGGEIALKRSHHVAVHVLLSPIQRQLRPVTLLSSSSAEGVSSPNVHLAPKTCPEEERAPSLKPCCVFLHSHTRPLPFNPLLSDGPASIWREHDNSI